MKNYPLLIIAAFVVAAPVLSAQVTPSNRPPPGIPVAPPGQPAAPAQSAPPPAADPTAVALAAAAALETRPADSAVPLPPTAGTLIEGYGTQSQQALILTYFATGTLGDALAAGSVNPSDGRNLAATYQTLAVTARDDLRRVRAAYRLEASELESLDKLAAAYADLLAMIQSTSKLADAPQDAASRASCDTARRRALATLSALFGWK